jgi:hypothetical protein
MGMLIRGAAVTVAGVLAAGLAQAPSAAQQPGGEHVRYVVAISVDGLNPSAITALGTRGAPYLNHIRSVGASTLAARSEWESTSTLPNHAGMLTSRPVSAKRGGHGVTFNDDRPGTKVRKAGGKRIESMFTRASRAGLGTAFYTAKKKFNLFERSWSGSIDRYVLRTRDSRLVSLATGQLRNKPARLTVVHMAEPDVVGHRYGYMSARYLRAITRADARVGAILRAVRANPQLAKSTVVMVTSDHGGRGRSHSGHTKPVNFRVPFLVWGRGVFKGDLYDVNPGYRKPSATRRPSYEAARQPIRNAALGNLALDVLGVGAMTGSRINARQDLRIFAP